MKLEIWTQNLPSQKHPRYPSGNLTKWHIQPYYNEPHMSRLYLPTELMSRTNYEMEIDTNRWPAKESEREMNRYPPTNWDTHKPNWKPTYPRSLDRHSLDELEKMNKLPPELGLSTPDSSLLALNAITNRDGHHLVDHLGKLVDTRIIGGLTMGAIVHRKIFKRKSNCDLN